MALFRCGSGAGLQETVLWTNPNPTTSMSSTTVTLSESVTGFDFIKIESRVSTSDSTTYSVLMPASEWSSDYCFGFVNKINTNYFVRRFQKVSDTSGKFDDNCQIYNATNNNTHAIPVAIYGVKVG